MADETYYYNDNFYFDFESLSEELFETEEEIRALPDEYELKVNLCELKPIIEFTAEKIAEHTVDEERYSEQDGDREAQRIIDALRESVDFVKLNSLIPKLWFPSRRFITFKKQDFINSL